LTIFYSVPFYSDATADIRNIFYFLSNYLYTLNQFRFLARCDYPETITKIPKILECLNTAHVPCVKRRLFPCFSVNGKCGGSVLWGQSSQFRRDHLLLHPAVMSTAARPGRILSYYSAQASKDQRANGITSYPSCLRRWVLLMTLINHLAGEERFRTFM
jgi:hypothetical protein